MKLKFREISIALWTAAAAMSGGCQHVASGPPAAAVAAPAPQVASQTAALPPLAGAFDGLDEAVLAALLH